MKKNKISKWANKVKLIRNWIYFCDCDYDRTLCSGYCDYYCRCSKITGGKINSIYYENIYTKIAGHSKITNIKEYCLDRILHKVIKLENFNIFGVPGYYGEEVAVEFDQADVLIKLVEDLEYYSETEAVEFILTLEYGYVLPDTKNKNWKIKSVLVDDIDAKYSPINQGLIEEYKKDIDLCMCLCTYDGVKYRLIDGVHRYSAIRQSNKIKMKIIYCDINE